MANELEQRQACPPGEDTLLGGSEHAFPQLLRQCTIPDIAAKPPAAQFEPVIVALESREHCAARHSPKGIELEVRLREATGPCCRDIVGGHTCIGCALFHDVQTRGQECSKSVRVLPRSAYLARNLLV